MEFSLVAFIINIIHFCMVAYVIVAPFINVAPILILNLSYTVCLMTHWYFNNNLCCLTVFESYITGSSHDKTFIHKIVDPIYNISDYSLNKLVWAVTIVSFLITVYKVYRYTMSLDKLTLDAFVKLKFFNLD